MRKIKDVLRLQLDAQPRLNASLDISKDVVSN